MHVINEMCDSNWKTLVFAAISQIAIEFASCEDGLAVLSANAGSARSKKSLFKSLIWVNTCGKSIRAAMAYDGEGCGLAEIA